MDKFLAQTFSSTSVYPLAPRSISFCERYTAVFPFPFRYRFRVSYRSVSLSLYYYPSSRLPLSCTDSARTVRTVTFLGVPLVEGFPQPHQVTHFCNPVSSTHMCLFGFYKFLASHHYPFSSRIQTCANRTRDPVPP